MFTLTKPTAVDVFAGCGGLSLGFTKAGVQVLAGFDSWQPAVDTYGANLDHPAFQLDLSDYEAALQMLAPYFAGDHKPGLIGGPPCQDFSPSGNRVEGSRADLTMTFARLVAHFQPEFFVMENVPLSQKAFVYKRALQVMKAAGYTVDAVVLDASFYGVPQARKRLFTIGHRDPVVVEMALDGLEMNRSAPRMTVRDHFGDALQTEHYYRHPRSYARRGIFSIDEPSPTIRGVNRPIPPGYQQHVGDSAPVTQARPLTTDERAQIQTFPADYQFVGSKTNVEQMIGNAVPVNLAAHVSAAVAGALAERSYDQVLTAA